MTFKIYLVEVAQFPNEADLLMVDTVNSSRNSFRRFSRPADNEIRCSGAVEGVGETGCWNGLPRPAFSRHHLAETAMRGPAKHISSLSTVPRSLRENVKRDIRLLQGEITSRNVVRTDMTR